MTTRTTAAWDLIRAADPLASTDVFGAWEQPSAQDLLHRITADVPAAAGASEDTLTVLEVRPHQVLTTRRRSFGAGLAAAAVVLVVVASVVAVRQRHQTSALSRSSYATTSASPQPTAPPSRQTTATGYAKALLAELPLPKGATRVDSAPIPELKQSPLTGNGIVDSRLAWWTVPGSFAATVGKMGDTATLPTHWKITQSFERGAGVRWNGWLIEVRDPNARFVSSVNLTVAAHGTTVGVAAQVNTYAIPVRTPEQVIPASVNSATFTFTGGGGRSYSSGLTIGMTGQRIETLAEQINATPTFVMLAVAKCPAPAGSVTVTFRSGSSRWSLNVNNGSFLCNAPTLTGTSGRSVLLTPSTALLTDVLTAAGLPSNYFNR